MSGHLLTLPEDLLIQHILARLDIPTLISCSSTCRHLKLIIESSALLDYLIKLQEMELIDNPAVSYDEIPLSKRSEMLREHEERLGIRWKVSAAMSPKLQNDYFGSIKGEAGALFILPLTDVQELHWTPLPWKEDQATRWDTFRPCDPSVNIAAFALSIEENDLVAFATWRNEAPIRMDSIPTLIPIKIHLMQYSTRLPYPGLASPIMDVCTFRFHSMDPPVVNLAIRNTNLVITIGHSGFQTSIPHLPVCPCTGHLSVWNWKTGEKKCEKQNIPDKDMGLVFLKDDIFLHGSPQGPTLNVYHIPTDPSPGNYDLPLVECLGLPTLKYGLFSPPLGFNLYISFLDNPTAIPSFMESSNPTVQRLFSTNNLGSILTIKMTFEDEDDCRSYLIITHYQTLLGRAERALSRHPNGKDSDIVPASPVIRWEEWGPDLTRMFWYDSEYNFEVPPVIVEAPCGFRLFVLGQRNDLIEVYDFGPAAVVADGVNGLVQPHDESSTLRWIVEQDDPGCHERGSWFKDVVHTKLPFVRQTFKGPIDGDWYEMYVDQSRIVGTGGKELSRIDVLYIG